MVALTSNANTRLTFEAGTFSIIGSVSTELWSLKCLDVQRMGQLHRIARLVGWNMGLVQAANPLCGSLNFPETRFPEHFVEISKVKGGAVLSIAENKIGKPAAERIEMTGNESLNQLLVLWQSA